MLMITRGLKAGKKKYVNHTVTLEPKSKLFIYSDGLVEAVNIVQKNKSGDDDLLIEFEFEMTNNIFKEIQGLPSDKFIDSLYQKLVEFRGSDDFDDDICMICLDIE